MLYRIKSNSPWRPGLIGNIKIISNPNCVMFYPINKKPYRIVIPWENIEKYDSNSNSICN